MNTRRHALHRGAIARSKRRRFRTWMHDVVPTVLFALCGWAAFIALCITVYARCKDDSRVLCAAHICIDFGEPP